MYRPYRIRKGLKILSHVASPFEKADAVPATGNKHD